MAGLESLLRGRELAGRYRIEEVIGRGGMGAVYRATDLRLGRDVAVKVITAAAGNDPQVRERLRARFRHEAASAARLPHHPNVVPVYDYGTDDELGLDYLVMELLRGEDLASRLQSAGPPPMGTALRILQHAARGVAVGHRSGLIHRDVKPGNVFLVREEDGGMQVRVLDFGIAKAMAEEDTTSGLTHDGRAPLSPAYASPEQLRGEARLTPASDVFSLGALGFQVLTGTRPFTEPDRNRMAAGMDVPAPALRARNAQVPEDVDAIIRRALSFDPDARFPNAGAMADALEAPLRALGETPAASYIPAPLAAPPPPDDDRTVAAGDDRTAFADDDRTMVAPPAHRPASPPPGASRGPGPVITPPRRRQVAQEPRGIPGVVWAVLLLAVLGIGGFLAWQQMGGQGVDRVVVADTAAVDTLDDTLTADDALMLSIEATRMLRQADYDSALALVDRALTVDPRSAEYLDQRAVALIGLGRHEEASEVLVDVTRRDPYYDLAYSHLAEARLAMGDTLSAMQALRRFIEVTQDAGDRARAMQWLQRITPPPAPIQPVPGPTDTTPFVPGPAIDPAAPPRDNPAPRPAPRDSIRLPE